jgi:sulfur carrier protein ThiS
MVKSLIKDFFIWVSIRLQIKVKRVRTRKTENVKIKEGCKVDDLIEKLDLKPDNLIVMKNNMPVPIDSILSDNQELVIVEVSSGG